MFKAILFFIFYTPVCFAQQAIPVISFQNQTATINPYVKLLGLRDKDALIIRASENIETDTISGSYLVVLSNGDMYRYGVYFINEKTHIRKTTVANTDKSKFLKNIEEIETLDASQLNLKQVTTKGGTKTAIDFTNYPNYHLELYQSKKVSKFYSQAAEGFIEARADGYLMRQKLVQLCKDLDFSETIKAYPIEQVKAKDTVYIRFRSGEFETKQKIAGDDYLYDIATGSQEHSYLLRKSSSKAISAEKDFIAKHKDEIIDYDFFLKYGYRTKFLHFRTLYIIDETEEKGKSPIYFAANFSTL